MSLARGSFSWRAFRVAGARPRDGAERLRAHAFAPVGDSASGVVGRGWVSARNHLDASLADAVERRFLVAAWRTDRVRPSRATIDARYELAERAEREAEGAERLSFERRRELKRRVLGEVAAATPAVPRVVPVVWDARAERLLVGATGEAAADAVGAFTQTFGREAELVVPKVEEDGATADAGADFLLWLWRMAEEHAGEFQVGGEATAVMLDAALVLAGPEAGRCAITRGEASPSTSPEAAAALVAGKVPERARLVVARGERQWTLTLGADLAMRSVRPPAPAPDDRFGDRLEAFAEAQGIADGLFALFAKARTGDPAEHAAARDAWIRGKGEHGNG